jgi:hypothetical protein
MIRSHALLCDEPIQEGGSAIAACGKPIHKTHFMAFHEENPSASAHEILFVEVSCRKCKMAIWEKRCLYIAMEDSEYRDLMSERGVDELAV